MFSEVSFADGNAHPELPRLGSGREAIENLLRGDARAFACWFERHILDFPTFGRMSLAP